MALKHFRCCGRCSCLSSVVGAACSRSPPPAAEAEEPETLSVTRWTDKTELFAEYPPLVVGADVAVRHSS